MNKETGGSAFPVVDYKQSGAGVSVMTITGGMTLRDYFAANAPITMSDAVQLFENDGVSQFTFGDVVEKLAGMRMIYADSMMEARK